MNNKLDRVKKYKNIIIFVILLVIVSGIILPKQLNDLDEIWNYNFARNIAQGKIPYRDFNMVTTPLLPIICGIILRLTANELMIMRILACILITAVLYMIYKIIEILDVNKYFICVLIATMFWLFYPHFCIDYNFTILLIILISIFKELKSIKKENEIFKLNIKREILLGILIGTTILLKQTVGLVISVIFIFNRLLLASNKNDYKVAFKIIGCRFIGVFIPVVALAIYLCANNIWGEFLDYTTYSIKTFTNTIPYLKLINGNYGKEITVLSILVPLNIIIMYFLCIFKRIKTMEQKNIFILFTYSVGMFIMVYPISDRIHFLIGSTPCIIALFYLLWLAIKRTLVKIKYNRIIKFLKYLIHYFIIFIAVSAVIISLSIIIMNQKDRSQYKALKHFKYIQTNSADIMEIDKFILEQEKNNNKVYILDATAAIYMIPIDKCNKDYDLFLKGNLGGKGEDGQIEKLKQTDYNTILLIMNEKYRRNWQNPEKVRDYIVNNWSNIGEISKFDIYIKE